MPENSISGVRIHHIDTRYHFVHKHIRNGLIKIVFVKSSINESDIFTKNVKMEANEKMSTHF
jgi:hypothetical protein